MSVPPLCKALALFNLLDDLEATERGAPLRTVRKNWSKTGLRSGDLEEIISTADATGDFEIVQNGGGTRIRVADFEEKRLNPSTLPEIEELSQAFRALRALTQRQPAQVAYGRRAGDAA